MPTILTEELAYDWLFKAMDEKEIAAIAPFQLPWEELSYYTLAKDFLSSHEPLKEFRYADLPALVLPGQSNDATMEEGVQGSLF